MGHARSQGDTGSMLRALAAELPSADQALDELIARAHQAEVAVGDDAVVEETIVEPVVVAPAVVQRRPAPWLAIAASFAGGLAVMFGVLHVMREPPVPPVAAAPSVTVTPIEQPAAPAIDSPPAPAAVAAEPEPAPVEVAPPPIETPVTPRRPRGARPAPSADGPVTKPSGLADPFSDPHQAAAPAEPAKPEAKKPPATLVNPF